jgi:hypothetical protein
MEIVAQESQTRPRQPQEQQHVGRRAAEHQRQADAAGRDQRDARRQAVHAVDQVERVHQRDEPEHRDDRIHPFRKSNTENVLEMDARFVGGGRHDHLPRQFHHRLEVEPVVQ